MYNYEYQRGTNASGQYLIDNPARPTILSKEVETALPGLSFVLFCDGDLCRIQFDQELTTEQENTLGATVQAHKDNS